MGARKAVLGVVIVVAVLVVVYFGFFFGPQRAERMKGAIGTVDKYRAEQISDEDVVLEGEAANLTGEQIEALCSGATDEEKAELFGFVPMKSAVQLLGKAPEAYQHELYKVLDPDEQFEVFGYAPDDTKLSILGRAPEQYQAKLVQLVLDEDPGVVIEAFGRLPQKTQAVILKGSGSDLDASAFGRAPLEKKAVALKAASDAHLSQLLGRMPMKSAYPYMGRNPAEFSRALVQVTGADVSSMFKGLPEKRAVEFLGKAPLAMKVHLYEVSEPYLKAEMMGKAPEPLAQRVLGRAPLHAQAYLYRACDAKSVQDLFGKGPDAVKLNTLGRAPLEWQGHMVKQVTDETLIINLFEANPLKQRKHFFEVTKSGLDEEAFGRLPLKRKYEVITAADAEVLGQLLGSAPEAARLEFLGRMPDAAKVQLARSATDSEIGEMLGAWPQAQRMDLMHRTFVLKSRVHEVGGGAPQI